LQEDVPVGLGLFDEAEVECQQLAGGHGEKHVTNILDKLGAANRTQAVARARKLAPIR